ncbi:MAG: hypothetical protein KDH16_23370, partial [Rhodocyclaceae bacterium]|nr:hypothetical protein [Rhodocyclaceae bacterium]
GNVGGNVAGSVASVTAAVTLPTIPTNWITAAGINSAAITSAKFASGAITSTVLASSAIGASQIASNAITSAKIAADAIGASQIAVDAIGASELATDAVSEIVAAVWAAASRTLTAATNFNNLSSADVSAAVWNAATATYGSAGSYGLLVETNLDAAVSGATAPTAAAVADAVWDEALAGHLGAGSTGEALNAAGAAGDPWTTVLPGAYGAGSAGKIIGDNINAPIATVDTVVDAIKAVTDNLPNSGALTSLATAAALATVDSNVDAILVDTAEIGAAGAGLTAIPWNASWDAEVQSECADALNAYDPPTKAELDSGFAGLNDIAATDIVTNGAITTLAGAVVNVDLVDVCTTNTDMRGTDSAYTGTPPTAAAIADQVWEEAIADHSGTSGSTAESLAAAGGSGDPWVTSLPGSYTGTQAGKILADILTDTGTTIPGQLDDMSGATFDTATDSLEAIRNRGDSAWTGGGSAPTVSEIRIEMDTNSTQLAKLGTPAGASMSADIAAVKSDTGAILTDTAEIGAAGAGLTALASASALATVDSNVDAILVDTGTTIPASIDALPTAAENRAEMDSNSTKLAAIVADTGELQADWANGGRLDLLIDAIKVVTDALPDSGALTSLATAAALATVDGKVDAILVDTDATIPGLISALNDLSAGDILTTQLTESYAADGTSPTLSQAIFLIQQFLYERSTSGATVTVKKLDGSTTAATLTLDDDTAPTSITRAS